MYNNKYWFWEGVIPADVCDRLVKENFDEKQAETAAIGGKDGKLVLDMDYRQTDIVWVHQGAELFDTTFDLIVSANKNAGWNIDITGLEDVQLGRYKTGGHYDWHEDIFVPDSGGYQRKLSCSIQLSDPDTYEGGDLIVKLDAKGEDLFIAPRKQGSVVVFPSMAVHKVTPVTSGERFSAVGWMRGPAFR